VPFGGWSANKKLTKAFGEVRIARPSVTSLPSSEVRRATCPESRANRQLPWTRHLDGSARSSWLNRCPNDSGERSFPPPCRRFRLQFGSCLTFLPNWTSDPPKLDLR
jgi:hypothetical protein